MLPAPNRLKLGREITRVYRRGKSGNAEVLSTKVITNGSQ